MAGFSCEVALITFEKSRERFVFGRAQCHRDFAPLRCSPSDACQPLLAEAFDPVPHELFQSDITQSTGHAVAQFLSEVEVDRYTRPCGIFQTKHSVLK